MIILHILILLPDLSLSNSSCVLSADREIRELPGMAVLLMYDVPGDQGTRLVFIWHFSSHTYLMLWDGK